MCILSKYHLNKCFSTVEQAVEILRVLPALFPSPSAPPKKQREVSEALVHVLEVSFDSTATKLQYSLSCYNEGKIIIK